MPERFDLYFEHDDECFEKPLRIRGLQNGENNVYVNYKNKDLQRQFCEVGIAYKLYDFENKVVIPFRERNEENVEDNPDEKIFYAPYLIEIEKEQYTKNFIENRKVIIPNGIRF